MKSILVLDMDLDCNNWRYFRTLVNSRHIYLQWKGFVDWWIIQIYSLRMTALDRQLRQMGCTVQNIANIKIVIVWWYYSYELFEAFMWTLLGTSWPTRILLSKRKVQSEQVTSYGTWSEWLAVLCLCFTCLICAENWNDIWSLVRRRIVVSHCKVRLSTMHS